MEQVGVQFAAPGGPQYIATLASATKATAGFTSGTTDAGNASAAADAKITKHAQTIDSLTAKIGLQKKQFDILTQELLKANDAYGAGSIQAQKKDLALQTLAQSIAKNEHALASENQALATEKAALIATEKADNDATKATDALGKEVQQTAKQVESSGGGFNAWAEIVKGALRTVGQFAVQELGQAARATAGFVKDSVGLAGDFQAGMLNFQSVAGKAVDTKGLNQFKDLFLSLGKELPVSTADVQKAAIEMVKGGIDPAIVAAGGLKQNIQFAAAAMEGDLVGAAEISSKILGGWAAAGSTAAEKAAFLTHATDQLTKAANASSVDVKELSLGIFNSQGIAKAAGVSFDDLTTTLAELAPRFASSSEAGTSLKNLIVRLNPTTKAAAGAMEGLGLYTEEAGSKFYDAQGDFVGFQKASELLKTSLVGLTKEQQAATLQAIFGNDAMSAASALAELGAQGYTDMATALTNANGVSDAAALKQQGYNVALDNAKGSVEALQITLGTTLLPVLTDLLNNTIAPGINTLTDFASALTGDKDSFDKLSPSLQDLASYAKDVAKAFEGWSDDTISLNTALDVMLPGITDLEAPIEAVAAGIATLAIASTVASGIETLSAAVAVLSATFTTAGGGMAGVVAILGGPVTIAIAAVSAAVALLVLAWQNDWGGIQEKTAAVWADLEPTFTILKTWLETNIPIAIQKLSDFWTDTLQPALVTVGNYIDKNIFPVLKDLSDVYLAAASKELDALSAVWTNILSPALTAAWTILKDDIIPIFAALVDVNIAILSTALRALTGIWQKELQPALTAVGDYISKTFGPIIKEIGNWMSATFGPTLQSVTKWLGDATGGFTGMGTAIQGTIKWLQDLATSISTLKLPDWATPGSPTPWEIALRGIGDALQNETVPGVNAFGFALSGMGTAAAAAATDVTGKLGDALKGTTIIKDAKTLGTNAIAGLVSGMESNLRAIDKVAGKVADKVGDAFAGSFQSHSPAGLTIPFGASLIGGLIVGVQQMLPGLTGLVDSLDQQLTAQFSHVSDSVSQQISDMVQDIQDKVKSAQDAFASLVASGFGATASISRQVASNLGAFADSTTAANAKATADALAKAETEARAMTDPEQGAKYFEMRSKQILELASLQKALATQQTAIADTFTKQQDLASQADQQRSALALAASDDERNAILAKIAALNAEASAQVQARAATQSAMQVTQQQLALIGTATDAEIKGFAAQQAASGSSVSDAAAQLREILNANLTVKGKTASLPGIDDPTVRALLSALDKLTSPAASPTQIASSAQYVTDSRSYSYSLGVQTNQSPQVLQQSYAVMAASAP